jgi:hypothetical protein
MHLQVGKELRKMPQAYVFISIRYDATVLPVFHHPDPFYAATVLHVFCPDYHPPINAGVIQKIPIFSLNSVITSLFKTSTNATTEFLSEHVLCHVLADTTPIIDLAARVHTGSVPTSLVQSAEFLVNPATNFGHGTIYSPIDTGCQDGEDAVVIELDCMLWPIIFVGWIRILPLIGVLLSIAIFWETDGIPDLEFVGFDGCDKPDHFGDKSDHADAQFAVSPPTVPAPHD